MLLDLEHSATMRREFQFLKQAILSAPLLHYPNLNKRFSVACDASRVGLGAVLYQPDKDSDPPNPANIVQFASRKLKEFESRYDVNKLEILAIIFACRAFHYWIFGRDFDLYSDHRALLYLHSSETLSHTLNNWLSILQEYSFSLHHIAGVSNVIPDSLSRQYEAGDWGLEPLSVVTNPVIQVHAAGAVTRSISAARSSSSSVAASSSSVAASSSSAAPTTNSAAVLPNHQQSKPQRSKVSLTGEDFAGDDKVPISNNVTSTASAVSSSLEIKNEDVSSDSSKASWNAAQRDKRLPAPPERIQLLQRTHALGHFGRQALYTALLNRERVWWPNMREEIDLYLKSCDPCLRYTVTKSGFHPLSSPISNLPWLNLQLDLSTSLPQAVDGSTVMLVVICLFSGFVLLRALENKTAITVARALYLIVADFGLPVSIATDAGTE
jgi:hypothetical protein